MKETGLIQFTIREMRPDENASVEKLFARSLGIVDRIVFRLSFEEAQKSARKEEGGTLVAECNSEIVGTVSMRIQRIKGDFVGFVDALAADRGHRGKGIGTALVENAMSWLEKRDCTSIYATADRYNSPSWNTFIHKGFSAYEIPSQIRDCGLSFLRLWMVEFHFLGFGTFFLKKSQGSEKPAETREALHMATAILGVSAAFWLQPLIRGAPLMLFPLLFAVVAVSILGHELSQKLVCRKFGLEATFKAWGSGILFNMLFGIVGSFFPAFGSTYIKKIDWNYRTEDKIRIMFAIGPLVSLFFALVFWVLSIIASEGILISSARAGYILNLMIAIFNLLPVQAAGGFVWDGKKILNWNRSVWLLLCAMTAALITIDVII